MTALQIGQALVEHALATDNPVLLAEGFAAFNEAVSAAFDAIYALEG